MKKFVFLIIISLVLSFSALGHGGRLDKNGGHYNRKTGHYHYHNGNSGRVVFGIILLIGVGIFYIWVKGDRNKN